MANNLHSLLLHDQRDEVENALQHNVALLNKKGPQGRTLLLNAIYDYKVAISTIQWLLQYNPDLRVTDAKGRNALYLALYRNDIDLIMALLKKGTDLNQAAKNKKTPFFLAYELKGKNNIIKQFLEYNPDINRENRTGHLLLQIALRRNDTAFISFLMEKDVDINLTGKHGRRPLFDAIYNTKVKNKTVQHLLQYSPDLKVTDNKGCTLLHAAVYGNHIEMITFLIKNGIDINQADHHGKTPLFWGCCNRKVKRATIESLLQYEPDAKLANKKGYLPLHEAAKRNDLSEPVFRKLLLSTLNLDILLHAKHYLPQELVDIILDYLVYCIWPIKQIEKKPHYYFMFLTNSLGSLNELKRDNRNNNITYDEQAMASAIEMHCRLK